MYWLILAAGLGGVLFGFVPLAALVEVGNWIAPTSNLQDKTILLITWLRLALPALGLATLGWLSLTHPTRHTLRRRLPQALATAVPVLPAILVLAAVLRLLWIIFYPTQLYADSVWYYNLAARLARGYGYVYDLESQQPTAAWPVGYPAFLALLFLPAGPAPLVAKLANVALSTFVVYQTWLLAQRIFDESTARFAALLLAVMPGFIVYSSLVCSDILFMALVIAMLNLSMQADVSAQHAVHGWRAGLLTGLLAGWASLTRSLGLLLVPLWLGLHWLVARQQTRQTQRLGAWALALVLGVGGVVLPWTLRNYVVFDKLIPVSTNGGVNLWIGNNPLATGGFVFPRDPALNPLVPLIGDEIAVDETGYREGLAFIRANPWRAVELLSAKVFYLYNANEAGLAWNMRSALVPDQPGTSTAAYALVNLVYTLYALAACFGLLALLYSPRREQPLAWSGVFVSLFWTLAHLPFFGVDRFVLPLLPFLTTYAAVGILAVARYGPRSA